MNSLKFITNSKDRLIYASTVINVLVGIVKCATAITISSELFAISGLYSLTLCMVKIPYLHYNSKKHKWEKKVRKQSAGNTLLVMNAFIIVLGILFLIFGCRMLYTGEEVQYSSYSVYVLALCSFIKLGAGIYWIAKLKGSGQLIDITLKLTNLSDALVSIAITQSALLVMKGVAKSAYYDGLFGILVGVAVTIIGAVSLFSSSKKTLSW